MTTVSAEHLALELRERHPEVQPLEADVDTVADWVRALGGDGGDTAVVAAVIVAWEALL